MSKSNTFENDLLLLIFNSIPIANLADNASAGPLANLYLALHTTDPGESGTQNTNEVAYTGYQRVAIVRTAAGWAVSGNSVSPVSPVEFNEMTGGTPGDAAYASIGTSSTGSGKILYRGLVTPSVSYKVGVVPRLRTTSVITED